MLNRQMFQRKMDITLDWALFNGHINARQAAQMKGEAMAHLNSIFGTYVVQVVFFSDGRVSYVEGTLNDGLEPAVFAIAPETAQEAAGAPEVADGTLDSAPPETGAEEAPEEGNTDGTAGSPEGGTGPARRPRRRNAGA